MPILMGRNYGSTETYGTAQYEIVNRNVIAVNRCVKRFLERIYNFELRFLWGSARAKVRMRDNRTVDFLKEIQARGHESQSSGIVMLSPRELNPSAAVIRGGCVRSFPFRFRPTPSQLRSPRAPLFLVPLNCFSRTARYVSNRPFDIFISFDRK